MNKACKNLALAAALLSATGSWQSLRAQDTFSGATLTTAGSNTYTGATVLVSGGSLITATNAGTLTLNGSGYTFNGGTVVNTGTLTLGNTALIGSGTLAYTNLPLTLGGTLTLANGGTLILHAGATIKPNTDGTYTVNANGTTTVSAGTGTILTLTGAGTVPTGTTTTTVPTTSNAGTYTTAAGTTGTVVTTPTGIVITMPIFFGRDYSGTVTRTSAAGTTTAGTFYFGVDGRGKLSGTITLDGASTTYIGALGRDTTGERGQTGSGYMVPADASFKRTPGAEKIPLYVTHSTFLGGTLDAGGNTLVFRGTANEIQPAVVNLTGGN